MGQNGKHPKRQTRIMSTGPLKIYFKLSCNLSLSMLLLGKRSVFEVSAEASSATAFIIML